MQDGGISLGPSAAILDDCFHMTRDFTHVRFEHCHEEANSVADGLARLCKITLPNSWFDEAPNAIMPLLVNDVVLITN